MTKEEKNEYFRIKNKERRLRKKEEKLNGWEIIKRKI
jgi:hypothetical protein